MSSDNKGKTSKRAAINQGETETDAIAREPTPRLNSLNQNSKAGPANWKILFITLAYKIKLTRMQPQAKK